MTFLVIFTSRLPGKGFRCRKRTKILEDFRHSKTGQGIRTFVSSTRKYITNNKRSDGDFRPLRRLDDWPSSLLFPDGRTDPSPFSSLTSSLCSVDPLSSRKLPVPRPRVNTDSYCTWPTHLTSLHHLVLGVTGYKKGYETTVDSSVVRRTRRRFVTLTNHSIW